MIQVLTGLVAIPMMLLNSLAGLVGGAWLLWMGEWKLVATSFLLAVSAPLWASLLILPGLLFAAPGAAALERGNTVVGVFCAALSGLWSYGVVTAWCLAVFAYVPEFAGKGQSLQPYFLLSYALATSPWAYLAQKDRQGGAGEASSFATAGACIGCAIVLIYALSAARPSFTVAVWFLSCTMAAFYIFSIAIVAFEQRQMRRYSK